MQSQNKASSRETLQDLGRGNGSIDLRGGGALAHRWRGKSFTVVSSAEASQLTDKKALDLAIKRAWDRIGKADRGEQVVTPGTKTLTFAAEDCFAGFEAMIGIGERKATSLDSYKRRWKTDIEPRVGKLRLSHLTRASALALWDELVAAGGAPASIEASWKCFVMIVNHARERGWVGSIDLRLPKAKRLRVRNARKVLIPTSEQAADIIYCTPTRWRLLVETAAQTAARISECLGLQWTDISLEPGNASISITKQLSRDGHLVSPKTENGVRTIPIGEQLRVKLLAAYNVAENKTGFVFGADTQLAGRYRLAARALQKAIRDAGVSFNPEQERISFHSFRHRGASQLVANGVDVKRVADFLGDTTQTVMTTYVQSVDSDENLGALLEVAS